MKLTNTLTKNRREYLSRLLDGPKPRDGRFGPTGFQCMKLGWIEWDYRHEGKQITGFEWLDLLRAGERPDNTFDERLTPSGRSALSHTNGEE